MRVMGSSQNIQKNYPASLFGVKISPRCKNIESKEGQIFKINNNIKII